MSKMRRHAWLIAYVLMFAANCFVLYRYATLNSEFKQSLVESCEQRQASRSAYRYIILNVITGHPMEHELREYTEAHLPPVEC